MRPLHRCFLFTFYVLVVSDSTASKSCTNCLDEDLNEDFTGYGLCDYKYVKEVDGYLKLHGAPNSWESAFLQCHHEGGILMSPIDENYKSVMTQVIKANQLSRGLLTGIHSKFSKGFYVSVEGIPLDKINRDCSKKVWNNMPEQRNFFEGVVALLENGLLLEVDSNEMRPYLCRRTSKPSPASTPCGSPDSDYIMVNQTGKCYKFHRDLQTWENAYRVCQTEGGHLLIINSIEERDAVKDIIETKPQENAKLGSRLDWTWIGFTDWDRQRSWMTIHGQTLEEAGYNVWHENEPNNLNFGGEFCGSMSRSIELNDLVCSYQQPYVCEKEPEGEF